MGDEFKARIAFISCGPGSRPHYAGLPAIFPKDVIVDFKGLELYADSLYEIEGKKDSVIRTVRDLQNEYAWDGIMVTAAPPEVLNPGLFEDLESALDVPITTALHACIAALRAYGARRVLLLTPFDERLNRLICEHLAKAGITASAPHPFQQLGEAMRLKPEEVFELTRKNLSAAGNVDAVYFQGAVLDPIKVVDKIETELHTTVVASNPAMLWYILSRLRLSYRIPGYGKLLEDWPGLDEVL
jgi:hypothetical protein